MNEADHEGKSKQQAVRSTKCTVQVAVCQQIKAVTFRIKVEFPSRRLSAARRVKGGARHEARRATVTHDAR